MILGAIGVFAAPANRLVIPIAENVATLSDIIVANRAPAVAPCKEDRRYDAAAPSEVQLV